MTSINRKKAIPKTLKRLVWNKYIGETIGKAKCLCCNLTDITQMSFHCGHIVAEANGGQLIVDNLRPICQSCNSSMGTINMDDFTKACKIDKLIEVKTIDIPASIESYQKFNNEWSVFRYYNSSVENAYGDAFGKQSYKKLELIKQLRELFDFMSSKYQNIATDRSQNSNLTQLEFDNIYNNFSTEKRKYGKLYKRLESAFSGRCSNGHYFYQWG